MSHCYRCKPLLSLPVITNGIVWSPCLSISWDTLPKPQHSLTTPSNTHFRGSLCQFRGHLDATAVRRLPATIKSVGLVLREEADMAAVNALAETAFGVNSYIDKQPVLRWSGWNNLGKLLRHAGTCLWSGWTKKALLRVRTKFEKVLF